ncbi:DUF397 domain-containing protein [Streptomyces sp. NPDC056257]|uniref:DUF397 domain-containing protein n=1 Tax=Streptomyces sp. NPDC056257 TaxID=3345765 RepID=UPI0035DA7CB4
MNTPNHAPENWIKSSYSQGQGECVEVAIKPGEVLARDSKNPNGPTLGFTPAGWDGFLRGLEADDFRP